MTCEAASGFGPFFRTTMSTQNKDTRGNLILIVAMLVVLGVWWAGNKFYFDKNRPPPANPENQAAQAEKDREPDKHPEKEPEKRPPPPPEEAVKPEVVTLGAPGSHLTVKLTSRGAGVLQVVANHFQAANPANGEPEWLDAERRHKKPLELVPEDANRDIASFLLYHYGDPKTEDFPLDMLGRRVWKRVAPAVLKDNEPVEEAVFETDVQGVKITKKFTLQPRDYHVGLEVKLELTDPQVKEKPFRYQMTGPHGLPIEGWFYASIYRNALIGQVDAKDNIVRASQDLREVSHKSGGDEVTRATGPIRYAFVQNQFFASGIAVQTRDQKDRDFLGQARPILLRSASRGLVSKADANGVVLVTADRKQATYEYATKEDRERLEPSLAAGREVILVHRTVIDLSGRSHEVITDVLDPENTAPIFHDDITAVVSTPKDDKMLKLRPGEPIVHKYVLYNGPVKVRLLNHLKLDEAIGDVPAGAPAVDPAEVDYYLDDLHLDTLTDYPSSAMGRAFSTIGVTQLVIWFTNRMHDLLWVIYSVLRFLPSIVVFGVCILLLTVLVRGAMHPVSRKQARATMRMQALQPELQKLKEKHKDDKQALQMAQMELYRKHGINPLGSCWMMFLQMPVFLGLYYCLQESIQFRLAPFLWIKSLTAPDMLIGWGDKIPWISKWDSYGSFVYLGPYFNVLPVIAVALMIVQQKLTMPPAADEQQEMQQKWMKYSMILFGLFFYKVAAGLCLYFIASSLWGFAERKLLPKKKPGELPPPVSPGRPTLMQRMLDRVMDAQRQQGGNGAIAAPPPAAPPGGKRKRGKAPAAAPDGPLAKVRAWWARLLEQAAKK
jgi:YidC/Oxa1 family membrane protein insertase